MLSNYLIDPSDYIKEKEIGKGNFGTVFLAHPKDNRKAKVAMKYIPYQSLDEQSQKHFIREILIMSCLKHPNLLGLIGFSFPSEKNNNSFVIYSKYIPNLTLKEVIAEDKLDLVGENKLNPTQLSMIVYGIASAMNYLHEKNIVHRDLKPENIFLDENFLPVLSDFGLSRFVSDDDFKMTNKLGTPFFMAPELFDDDAVTTNKIDVYAFGVTLLSFFSPNFKFEGKTPKTIDRFINHIVNGKRFKIPQKVPDFYISLIKRCWSTQPTERPSFDEIVKEFESNDDFLFKGADADKVHEYIEQIKLRVEEEKSDENLSEEESNIEESIDENEEGEETEEFEF